MTTRYYSNTAGQMALTGAVTSGSTSITVDSVSGLPTSYPYTLALDSGGSAEELVSVTNASGTTLTVTRAADGTTAQAHDAGAVVEHVSSAQDFRDSRNHENASSGVHGITGSVVGTDDPQTLDNKTYLASGTDHAPITIRQQVGGVAPLVQLQDSSGVDAGGFYPTGLQVPGYASRNTAGATVDGKVVNMTVPSGANGIEIEIPNAGSALLVTKSTVTQFSVSESGVVTAVGAITSGGDVSSSGASLNNVNTRVTTLEADTGWVSATVNGGFAAAAGRAPQCRRKNGIVYLRGGISGTGLSTNSTITAVITLPSGYRPPVQMKCLVGMSDQNDHVSYWTLNTDGTVDIDVGTATHSFQVLDGITYPID